MTTPMTTRADAFGQAVSRALPVRVCACGAFVRTADVKREKSARNGAERAATLGRGPDRVRRARNGAERRRIKDAAGGGCMRPADGRRPATRGDTAAP